MRRIINFFSLFCIPSDLPIRHDSPGLIESPAVCSQGQVLMISIGQSTFVSERTGKAFPLPVSGHDEEYGDRQKDYDGHEDADDDRHVSAVLLVRRRNRRLLSQAILLLVVLDVDVALDGCLQRRSRLRGEVAVSNV